MKVSGSSFTLASIGNRMLLRVKQKIIGFKTEYCKITFTFYFKYQDSNNKFTIGRELK